MAQLGVWEASRSQGHGSDAKSEQAMAVRLCWRWVWGISGLLGLLGLTFEGFYVQNLCSRVMLVLRTGGELMSNSEKVVCLESWRRSSDTTPQEFGESVSKPVRLSEELRGSIDEGLKKQMREQMRKKHGL